MNRFVYLLLCITIIFTNSCKKEETIAYFQGGTNPVLTAIANSGGSVIELSPADSSKNAISLSWTNPDYKFNNGASSLNVTYLLEIDTAGSNFTNKNRIQITVSQETGLKMTESSINSFLTNAMGLDTSFSHNLEMRVASYMVTSGPGADTLYSNVLKFTAKPYYPPPLITPPADGKLYIVGGDALLGAWQNGGDFASQNQQFTVVTPTLYTITVNLSGGDQFLFVPKWGDWGHKYACKKTSSQSETGGSFGYDWSDNFPAPSSAGTYKIDVDFQHGTYSITKL